MRPSLLVPWAVLLLVACIRAPVEGGDPAIVGADFPDVAVADVPEDVEVVQDVPATDVSGPSCIQVVPAEFAFFRTCRPLVELTVTIKSCGTGPLTVSGIGLEAGAAGFELDYAGLPSGEAPTLQAPLVLPSKAEAQFGVVYRPAASAQPQGVVVIDNDSSVGSRKIATQVYDLAEHCPTPIASIDGPAQVAVGTVVTLHGGASCSLNGDLASYHWTVIPPGADASGAVALADTVDATDSPAMAGTYRYCLDACDAQACSDQAVCRTTACEEVQAVAP